jgi:hypothetical protein
MRLSKACRKSEEGDTFISLWSITHFLFFLNMGLYLRWRYLTILILSVCWEVFEIVYYGYGHESFKNVISDIIFNLLGFSIGLQLPLTVPNALIFLLIYSISTYYCSIQKNPSVPNCNDISLADNVNKWWKGSTWS